jgi:UDP-N-acetylglucosamine transferase subunit ALG13
MIFVTVGTELPFDRMVKIVDSWAAQAGRQDVFAQVGNTEWRPTSLEYQRFLEPAEFAARFASASVIIAHAGMGTILSALHAGKPIIVVPRLASLGEHRNEHQLATARRMQGLRGVAVAYDETDLIEWLGCIDEVQAGHRIAQFAERSLLDALRRFIHEEPEPKRQPEAEYETPLSRS